MRRMVLLLLVGLLPLPAFGQRSTATLSGTVSDTTGAVVPGAQVTATNLSTGATTTTVSNTEGFYVLTGLLAGVYRLRVETAGFQAHSQDNIVLQVDRPATVNASLTLGSPTETVTVTSEASQVNLRSQTLTYSITAEMITGLPLNGRNVTQLMALAPDSGLTSGGYLGNSSHYQPAPLGRRINTLWYLRTEVTALPRPSTSTED